MKKIISFKVLEDYRIWMQFQDGHAKIIDFRPLIGSGVSAPLLEKDFFDQVAIDNGGGLEWPNGMDFCPNYLWDYSPDLVENEQ